MLPISINPTLKHTLPGVALGCISASVKVDKHNDQLWQEVNQHLAQLRAKFTIDQIGGLPQIAATRSAYKALGKDPSRYRGSAEAMLRRILSGKGLYQINTVVDINNLVSLESLFSIGLYDLEKIKPPIELRAGQAGESYKGIGKDVINIEGLPVLADAHGPFGNPSSDSERTMVRLETAKVLMAIFSFAGPAGLDAAMARACDLLQKYSGASGTTTKIVAKQ